jgi:glycosyltransferase involved in cell wall biosynthesis
MALMPKISVVMSVFNGEADLAPTLESILAQTEGDFELIAIDDGSRDATPSILAEHARRDARMRVITQQNTGLTRALIRGCAEAKAPVIARHDCGDRSRPERFARQLQLFDDEDVVAASVTTRFVTRENELLYVTRFDGDEIRRSVLCDDDRVIHGFAHGAAVFRRSAYVAAGGYRPQFRVAQDLDLWVRLAPLGRFASVTEELYDAVVDASSISSIDRDAQILAKRIIVGLRDGGDEAALLAEAANLRRQRPGGRQEAAGFYFIARCLRARHSESARRYLLQAVRRNPLHWRAWASLLTGR